MARRSLKTTFTRIISGEQKKYGSLFECTCAPLNRTRQPFRDTATKQIIDDLLALFPPKKQGAQPLVLVFDQPGGLLFEFILINHLIHQGFTHLTIILIQKSIDQKALSSFSTWFRSFTAEIVIKHFKTVKDYTAASTKNTDLIGNALIAIDPDRALEIPQWESAEWREKWREWREWQQPQTSYFYSATLFFQTYQNQKWEKQHLCHLVRTVTLHNQQNSTELTIGLHQSGRFAFTTHILFAYYGEHRLLPFASKPLGIQAFPQGLFFEHPLLQPLVQFLQQEAAGLTPLIDYQQQIALAQVLPVLQQFFLQKHWTEEPKTH